MTKTVIQGSPDLLSAFHGWKKWDTWIFIIFLKRQFKSDLHNKILSIKQLPHKPLEGSTTFRKRNLLTASVCKWLEKCNMRFVVSSRKILYNCLETFSFRILKSPSTMVDSMVSKIPDITLLNVFFWGYVKDRVYEILVPEIIDLKWWISEVFAGIPAEILKNTSREIQ